MKNTGVPQKMIRTYKTLVAALCAVTLMGSIPQSAEAGPLLDWLRGRKCCLRPKQAASNCTTCGFTPQAAAVAPNAFGLQPGQCMKTCQQTCSRVVVNYVPHTAYRTDWKQVPVTQYKPVTNTDPCTGCTVTCMKPCTTYSYQCQRVPYTTYRPVYRTQTYKVPVTTITNDCATGNCGTCATGTCGSCPTGTCGGTTPAAANYAPTPAVTYGTPTYSTTQPAATYTTPSGGLSTGGGFQASPTPAAPANIAPSLDGINPQGSSTRLPIPDLNQSQASRIPYRETPTVASVSDRISNSTVRRQFAYSPVRFASHRTVAEDVRDVEEVAPRATYQGSFKPVKRTTTNVNSGWETVK